MSRSLIVNYINHHFFMCILHVYKTSYASKYTFNPLPRLPLTNIDLKVEVFVNGDYRVLPLQLSYYCLFCLASPIENCLCVSSIHSLSSTSQTLIKINLILK